jgi:peptide/nickel transport system substrate-binding protein
LICSIKLSGNKELREVRQVKPKRAAALLLAVVVGMFSVGFAASATANDEIVVAHIGQITSIDPAYANFSSNSNTVYSAVYETLLNFSKDSLTEYVPMLATAVPSRANGLIIDTPTGGTLITFPIREGVKFHQGGTLTPEDVKYSFLRKLTLEGPGGESAPILQALSGYESLDAWAAELEGVETFADASQSTVDAMFAVLDETITVGEGTVTFRLSQPTGLFLQFISHYQPAGIIVDKEWTIEQGAWPGTAETWLDYYNPNEEATVLYATENGTGPYMISRWDITNQEMSLVAFEEYWQGPAAIKTIRLEYVEEWSTRLLMLQNGDADFAYVPPNFMPQVRSLDNVVVADPTPSGVIRVIFYQWPISGTRFTGSGQLDGNGIPADFFGQVEIRKAFNMLLDWDAFIADILSGNGLQIKGACSLLCAPNELDIPVFHYDPAGAEALLREAYDGELWEKGFTFTAVHNSGNFLAKSALEMIREELRNMNPNFDFEIKASTWNEFIPQRTASEIPMFYSGWGFDDPAGYGTVNAYLASDGYFNPYIPGMIELAQEPGSFDDLLDAALRTFDDTERNELLAEAMTISYENATHLWLVEEAVQMVYRSEVKGWYFSPVQPGINMPGIPWYSLYKE